ncbi:MAG: hypothetical protein H6816_13400 [Phycisphaerales bacterium]|nr:hypothetical protein [Phycisphaerales bacterium]
MNLRSKQLCRYSRRITPGVVVGTALALAWCVQVTAQTPNAPRRRWKSPPTARRHTCDAPTVENPCLQACTRPSAVSISEEFKHKHGPTIVILDELEDRYLPVPFDHKGHANMANMTRGCQVCHHYTPEGLAHPACRTCHELNPVREDMRKPSLKGAYHRQCMSCHREWSGNTECGACHHPKTGVAREAELSIVPSKDDLIGRMHPPIPEPDTKIYKTRVEGKPPTEVLFRHQEHIKRYGLTCAECHREDNCARCHQDAASRQPRERTLADHHRPCMQCHENVNPGKDGAKCEVCHYDRRSGPPRPFEHTITDLPLMKYHRSNTCRECHVTVPFAKLNPECGSCHDSWTQANFKHEITGQILDERHGDLDCTDCHADRAYTAPPTCNECHESEGDDAVIFPKKRPGPVVRR